VRTVYKATTHSRSEAFPEKVGGWWQQTNCLMTETGYHPLDPATGERAPKERVDRIERAPLVAEVQDDQPAGAEEVRRVPVDDRVRDRSPTTTMMLVVVLGVSGGRQRSVSLWNGSIEPKIDLPQDHGVQRYHDR
jgi:hypothetical protein